MCLISFRFLLSLCVVGCIVQLYADTKKIGDYTWTYRIENGCAIIESNETSDAAVLPKPVGRLEIPSELGGFPVVKLGPNAFYQCWQLKEVVLPNGIVEIGEHSFAECDSLSEVYMPESVTTIGDSSFWGSGLKTVTIPSSVRNVADGAFEYCFGLTNVTIRSGVIDIGRYAFGYCTGLQCITIPSSVKTLGTAAFIDCSSLMFLTVQHGVSSIGESAFAGCLGLTTVALPLSVKNIGANAFYECSSITSVSYALDIPLSRLFSDAYICSLERVEIVDGVREICANAFSGCLNLREVSVPPSLISWKDNRFEIVVADRLEESILPAPPPTSEGIWFSRRMRCIAEDEVFMGWSNDDVKISTEEQLLAVCKKGNVVLRYQILPRMTLVGTVLTVNGRPRQTLREAFPDDYVKITKIVVGNDVAGFPTGFFDGCSSSMTVQMSDSVRGRIGYDDLLPREKSAASYDRNGLLVYDGWVYGVRDKSVHSLTITAGIVGIAGGALADMQDLETVEFPESLRYIGDRAFAVDTYLDNVILPESLEPIVGS